MLRLSLTGAAAAALLAGLTVVPAHAAVTRPAADPPEFCGYTPSVLPPPAGVQDAVAVGSDGGTRLVGSAYVGGGHYRAVVWKNGKPTLLKAPHRKSVGAGDVNVHGVAIGRVDGHSKYAGAYAWVHGKPVHLAGGIYASPAAINADGLIVGQRLLKGGDAQAIWWSVKKPGSMHVLKGARVPSTATGVNDSGKIVGYVGDEEPTGYGFYGTTHGVHRLAGLSKKSSKVSAVDGNYAIGLNYPGGADTTQPWFRWHKGTYTLLPVGFRAAAVNRHGVVAGPVDGSLLPGVFGKVKDEVLALPALTPTNVEIGVSDVLDDDSVLGVVGDPGDTNTQSVIWHYTCTPATG